MDWVTVDGGWWQQVFSIKIQGYLMRLRQCVPLDDPKTYDHKIYGAIVIPLVKFDIYSL